MATAPKIKHEHFPVREISLKALVIDDAIQSRVKHDVEHQRYFAGLYAAGRAVAPPTVFENPETFELILADGFHRTYAAIAHGLKSMPCEIRPGDRNDAYVYSAGANQEMSLNRTFEDIKKACFMLFALPEWWSRVDAFIGNHVGCSYGTVTKYRAEFASLNSIAIPGFRVNSKGIVIAKRAGKTELRQGGRYPRLTPQGNGKFFVAQVNGSQKLYRGPKEHAEAQMRSDVDRYRASVASEDRLRDATFASAIQSRGIHAVQHGSNTQIKHKIKCLLINGVFVTASPLRDRESIPEAIGRLLLASSDQPREARRVLVCPKSVIPDEIIGAIGVLGIEVVTFGEFVDIAGDNGTNHNPVLSTPN